MHWTYDFSHNSIIHTKTGDFLINYYTHMHSSIYIHVCMKLISLLSKCKNILCDTGM